MSSKREIDEASRGNEASSSSDSSAPQNLQDQFFPNISDPSVSTSGQDNMKRAAAKQLIEKYFYQLLDGCGNTKCDNPYCASSGVAKNYTPNEAAAEAIKLFYKEAKLCDRCPSKVPRTEIESTNSSTSTTQGPSIANLESKVTDNQGTSASPTKPNAYTVTDMEIGETEDVMKIDSNDVTLTNGVSLTEEYLCMLCDNCIETKNPTQLIRALGEAFAQPSTLSRCFPFNVPKSDSPPEVQINSDMPKEKEGTEEVAKEERAQCSCDPDKDVDSIVAPDVDVQSCRRAFSYLSEVPPEYYVSQLVTAVSNLASSLEIDLRVTKKLSTDEVINCFVIIFELPDLGCGDYLDTALPNLCRAAEFLSIKAQAKLARAWATHCQETLRTVLESLQQLITLRVISTNYSRHFTLQDDSTVIAPTKLMKIVYYASMLAGVMEPPLREQAASPPRQADPLGDAFDHLYPLSSIKGAKTQQPDDPLAIELGVNVLDARKPYVPFEDFYNEPLSDAIEMDKDFANYKTEISNGKKFAYLKYPFILTSASKSLGLYYENRIRMYSERRLSLLHAVVSAAPCAPYLRLSVRRDRLIEDALVGLEMIAMERALDLKKQLVVEFEGEQGVDEGGVSKEFFQLIVEEIFNPDYGMFVHQTESNTVWFNPTSFETEAQFTLIGIVLGLAIYNNVILAVNFPMILYRKLMGRKGSFEDLADWNPTLYRGLKDMLQYVGDDLQEVYYQTFRIGYQDVFGSTLTHDLVENGDNVFVTQSNKQEFVDKYADFLLNTSVEVQFQSFRRGFVMVTDESPLAALFRPEEVEALVCGSKNFDFVELERSTEYDGGYTAESQTIKDFWSVVHSFTVDEKRKLLQFTTGSDRVPVGGLSHLKLVVARNGPDSDRLPTAHTCFNVLLLPDYASKEKLHDRLLKAISYSKGFGML